MTELRSERLAENTPLGSPRRHLEAEEVGGPIEHGVERLVHVRHVEEDRGGIGVRLAARGDLRRAGAGLVAGEGM